LSIKKCFTTLLGKKGKGVKPFLFYYSFTMKNSPYAFSDNPKSIGNLKNILEEIKRSAENSDILLVSGWIESLKDRMTLDGTRRYYDYTESEKKVLSAMNILLSYSEVSQDLPISKQDLQTLTNYVIDYFKQFV
jgi:hypothetical protein